MKFRILYYLIFLKNPHPTSNNEQYNYDNDNILALNKYRLCHHSIFFYCNRFRQVFAIDMFELHKSGNKVVWEEVKLNIYTIGHSVHTKEKFISMLKFADIKVLADVRAFPASRKFPHFKKEKMQQWLPEAGIDYVHLPLLAGRRNKSEYIQNELNDNWENQSFHNYADYTLTKEFSNGIKKLKQLAKNQKLAYCCSERHPARCHRLLISNWLSANGWKVYHIIDGNKGETNLIIHILGKWGAIPIIEESGTVEIGRAHV